MTFPAIDRTIRAMRNWNLKPSPHVPLLLSTDLRLSATEYCNDQTWELIVGGGEPPALSIQTTYGLRARLLRIFPRFSESDNSIIDPSKFTIPVKILHTFPNFLSLSFSPLHAINVEIEYWVPEPQVITSRLKVSNVSPKPRSIRLECVASLIPIPGGKHMMPTDIGLTHILAGNTQNLVPVLYFSRSAQPGTGPFRSLFLDLAIPPKDSTFVTWALSSTDDITSSYELAYQTFKRNWEAEIARIIRTNANLIEIHTGDPSWDAAFTLAQYRALGLLFHATNELSHPSYVSTRLPDLGFSFRGNCSDYSHLWNGQTPLETYYLVSLLLPAHPEIAKGLLLNFLNTQTTDGLVDLKPGLAGQRSQVLATPLLSFLAWCIYKSTEDLSFLEQVFPKLFTFVQQWFDPQYDHDADGIPEWDRTLQTGFDDHPLFSPWHTSSPGVAIKSVESPDLCALLHEECSSLIRIADLVDRADTIPTLQAHADRMKVAVEAAWDESSASYHYWDRDSHQSMEPESLGTFDAAGEVVINRKFDHPNRLQIDIQSKDDATRPLQIFIHGTTPSGGHRVEKINSEDMLWYQGRCKVTSKLIYMRIEHIGFQGLVESDQVTINTVGHTAQDITNLLPLWAGIPDSDRGMTLIKNTISNPKSFWGNYGLPNCAKNHPTYKDEPFCKNSFMPYNCLIGEALLRYGQYSKAATLVTRLMKAVTQSLEHEGAFRRCYNSETGLGSGERNTLCSLPPLGLFLEVLGVHIINPQRLILSGSNPFRWPVTVKYMGLTVMRHKKKTMVIFPNGQNITLTNGNTFIVGLE